MLHTNLPKGWDLFRLHMHIILQLISCAMVIYLYMGSIQELGTSWFKACSLNQVKGPGVMQSLYPRAKRVVSNERVQLLQCRERVDVWCELVIKLEKWSFSELTFCDTYLFAKIDRSTHPNMLTL